MPRGGETHVKVISGAGDCDCVQLSRCCLFYLFNVEVVRENKVSERNVQYKRILQSNHHWISDVA